MGVLGEWSDEGDVDRADDKDEGDKERKGICSAPGVSRRANQAQTSTLPPPAVHHPTFLTDSWLKILFG